MQSYQICLLKNEVLSQLNRNLGNVLRMKCFFSRNMVSVLNTWLSQKKTNKKKAHKYTWLYYEGLLRNLEFGFK